MRDASATNTLRRMSYRALKRLLGEANFELKVLVMFGTGLTLLAVGTFFLYRWQTSDLLDRTTRPTQAFSPLLG